MKLPIYFVGTPSEVGHHAAPLRGAFDVRIEDAEAVGRHARPGDMCVFYNEFFPGYRLVNHELVRRQCATLFAIDGILEWRSLWQFPPHLACAWSARPILSHKIACVGRSQARILESWGHADQCEVVGVPRFDALRGRVARTRPPDEPFTILVLTAKCPGFDQNQLQRAAQSLIDLRTWLEAHPRVGSVPVRSLWRITQGLEQQVGVDNSLRDTTGLDLAQVLAEVDAVVTTPSTAMLEGMLQQVPVALLDYNNCPHYVPAAWRITAPTHFDQVISELVSPPPAKVQYQHYLLHDALECQSPALPRLVELIERMHAHAQRSLSEGRALAFPRRMVPIAGDPAASVATPFNHEELLPMNRAFADYDLRRLQAEVGDLRASLLSLEKLHRELVVRRTIRARIGRLRDKFRRKVQRLFPSNDEPVDRRRAA